MLKMDEHSKEFLKRYRPDILEMEQLGEALSELYDFILDEGFEPPRYELYNDLGVEAQRVYDDLYYTNKR